MARPSLPTLTWTRSAVTNITTGTMNEVLEAIKNLIAASTHWEVVSSSTDTGAVAVAFIQIGAKSGTAMPKQRISIAVNGTGTIASGSMALKQSSNTTRRTVPTAFELCVAYAPEGADAGTFTVDSVTPWNTPDQRSIGYGVWGSIQSSGTDTFNVWLIESDEVLAVAFENATDNRMHGFIAGPTLIGASTASNDVDASDRIYSLAAGNNNEFSQNYWTSQQDWLGTYAEQGGANFFWHYAFDPSDTDKYCQLYKMEQGNSTTGTDSVFDGGLVSGSGAFVGLDVNFWTRYGCGYTISPGKYIGTYRQMRIIRDNTSRVVLESGGSNVAIVWGSDPINPDADAMAFTNS
jgi:hypothetical protein